MLPQGFLQDLLSRVDLVEVVGRQVELKKAGINHKGLCPFHGEKSPSFIVSPSRQTYHCFGCGAHGDAIRFLMEQGGLGFIDAVRDLAQSAGVAVPESDASPADRARAMQEREQRSSISEVLAKAGEHYRRSLKDHTGAVDYLKRRGLTGDIAARFGLGYAPEGWRTLASVFASYDDPLLAESGLVIVQGEDGEEQKRYDRFRDRIMFPIRSVRGEIIGFGGRVLDQGEPKYLNSPETPVFHKGQELYGLYEARQALREHGYALVVEGYMDVVALAQSGFGNAVATLGTACSAEHVAKLLRFTDAVVFSFDGDAAGRRAAARALEAALPHATDTRSIRFLFLPPEHDPDSFVRERGAEAFEQAVAQAVPLSKQMLEQAAVDCDLATAEGRSRMISQARPMIELLPDGLLREQVVAALAQRGGMAADLLRAHWSRRRSSARGKATTVPIRPMAGRRPSPQTATQLDRAAWLLAAHSPLWHGLPQQVHEFLVAQPQPHGLFFAALERVLNDHGAIALPAMLVALEADADAALLSALIARIRGFHANDDAPPVSMFEATLHQLRLQAVQDELLWLIESGELSEAAAARRRQLVDLQAEMKRVVLTP